jgi:hypothetical protein
VTLTPTPNVGATFSGWSGGGCAGTAACTLRLGGDTLVTATFANTPPGGGGGGGGTGTPQPGPGPSGGGGTTAPAPLNARITKSSINARNGTAKFTLTASGGVAPLRFECSLVKKGAKAKFKACKPTTSYKRLKKGAYVFSFRVRDARGQIDATPATKRFSSRRR